MAPQDLIDAVTRLLQDSAPAGWLRIVSHWEVELDDAGRAAKSSIELAVVRGDGGLVLSPFVSDSQAGLVIGDVHAQMRADDEQWSTMELTVDRGEGPRVEFGTQPAKRLHGVEDEESFDRFTRYLDDHRAELEELAARIG